MKLEDKIDEIKIFGSLGYSPDQISDALELAPELRLELTKRLAIPGDAVNVAYKKGFVTAESKIDVALAKQAQTGEKDSIEIMATRSRQRKIRDLKMDLFGI